MPTKEITIGSLLQIGWSACLSAGLGVATIMADGSLPDWLRAGIITTSALAFLLSAAALRIQYLRQEADLKLEREYRIARLPRQAYVPTALPDPKDGGETPTPEFLGILFEYHHTGSELPPVRAQAFAAAKLNPSRVQAMYTRMITWRAIAGRVQGVSSGRIAEGWTLVEARARMILERPDYGVTARA